MCDSTVIALLFGASSTCVRVAAVFIRTHSSMNEYERWLHTRYTVVYSFACFAFYIFRTVRCSRVL